MDAANQLFYEEGVHSVGVDRVIERAGVAKATLYTVFGNKDGLVRAYLSARHDRTISAWMDHDPSAATAARAVATALVDVAIPEENVLPVPAVIGTVALPELCRIGARIQLG